MKAKNLG